MTLPGRTTQATSTWPSTASLWAVYAQVLVLTTNLLASNYLLTRTSVPDPFNALVILYLTLLSPVLALSFFVYNAFTCLRIRRTQPIVLHATLGVAHVATLWFWRSVLGPILAAC